MFHNFKISIEIKKVNVYICNQITHSTPFNNEI